MRLDEITRIIFPGELRAASFGNQPTDFRSNTPGSLRRFQLQLFLLTTDHVVDPLAGGEGNCLGGLSVRSEKARGAAFLCFATNGGGASVVFCRGFSCFLPWPRVRAVHVNRVRVCFRMSAFSFWEEFYVLKTFGCFFIAYSDNRLLRNQFSIGRTYTFCVYCALAL